MTLSPRREHNDGDESGIGTGARSPIPEPQDEEEEEEEEEEEAADDDGNNNGSDEYDGDSETDLEDMATRDDREDESEDDMDWSWEAIMEWVQSKNFWREFWNNIVVPLLKGLAWNTGIILSTKALSKYIVTDMFFPFARPDPGAQKTVPNAGASGGIAVTSSVVAAAAATATAATAVAAVASAATSTTAAPLKVTHMYYPHFARIMRQSQRYSM